jgi:hypothetical protein
MNRNLVGPSTRRALGLGVAAILLAAAAAPTWAADKAPLKIKYPEPTLRGTPEDLPSGPGIEPPPKTDPEPLLVPEGVKNVALNKPVTSSVKPFTGELSQLVDGAKEAFDTDAIEMRSGTQWVQIDLGEEYEIHAIAVWHDHRYIQITRDAIVQISNDPEFKEGVKTVFNNDRDDSSKQGPGTDKEYFETKYGKVIPVDGVKARYVRAYSKGTSLTALNCWQEIEVYALPAK